MVQRTRVVVRNEVGPLTLVFVLWGSAPSHAAEAQRSVAECIKLKLRAFANEPKEAPRVQTAAVSAAALQSLFAAEKVEPTFTTYAVIPRDRCEFQVMFGDQPTAAHLADVDRATERLAALAVHDGSRESAEGFISFIAASKERYVVVIGHNDKGMFKFPDGSWLGLADMAETCATHGKRCVFLSCEAQQHVSGAAAVGSARRLTYDEASTVANDIRGLSDVGPVSLADVADVLVRAQRKYQTNRLIVRAVGGGAVAILVAHELLDDEEKK